MNTVRNVIGKCGSHEMETIDLKHTGSNEVAKEATYTIQRTLF